VSKTQSQPRRPRTDIAIPETLRKLFPTALILQFAKVSGAFARLRVIRPVEFFWTLVLGFGVGRARSLAGLRRMYERSTGHTIEESSFYDRFTPKLVKMLKLAVDRALRECVGVGRSLVGPLAAFRDVLLTDSTVIRLHALLAKAFPGSRTNHSKAALKAHAIISVTGAGKQSVKITSGRRHDGPVLRAGQWLAERLLIFDLGYFNYQLFSCIRRNRGYFLSRLKAHANPVIVAINRVHRGRAIDLIGRKLREVVARLERDILDITVEVQFPRRRYRGKRSSARELVRIVGIRDEQSGEHHLYMTNVPVEKLAAEDIRAVYALRWEIELLWKELKLYYRIEDMPSRKQHVVECLLFVALLTLVVSRKLQALIRKALGEKARRVTNHRWAALFTSLAADLLLIVLRPVRELTAIVRRVVATFLHEATDPNVKRRSLLEQVEHGTHAYRSRQPV